MRNDRDPTPQQRLKRVLNGYVGETLLPPDRQQIVREFFAEAGTVAESPLQETLDEEVRDEVVEERVGRRFSGRAQKLRKLIEDAYGDRLHDTDYLFAGRLAQGLQRETIGLLKWMAREEAFDINQESASAALATAYQATLPVLVVPHLDPKVRQRVRESSDDLPPKKEWAEIDDWTEEWEGAPWEETVGIACICWGRMCALQETARHVLHKASEGEEREVAREKLESFVEQGRVIPALARLQELVMAHFSGPLLKDGPWKSAALKAEADQESFAYRVLGESVQEVSLAALLTMNALVDDIDGFAEAFGGQLGVRSRLLSGGSDESPDSFLLAVNDPYVSQAAIDRAVREARQELQRQTTEAKLAPDDREFLKLVAQVEDEYGVGPEDRRPHGFWSDVRERWNEEHPDDTLSLPAIRTRFHRKGPTSEVREVAR